MSSCPFRSPAIGCACAQVRDMSAQARGAIAAGFRGEDGGGRETDHSNGGNRHFECLGMGSRLRAHVRPQNRDSQRQIEPDRGSKLSLCLWVAHVHVHDHPEIKVCRDGAEYHSHSNQPCKIRVDCSHKDVELAYKPGSGRNARKREHEHEHQGRQDWMVL